MKKGKISLWYFPAFVFVIYLFLSFLDRNLFLKSSIFFFDTMIKIIPVFLIVFLMMSATNYFIDKKLILAYLKKGGLVKWLFAIIAGILSTGPIYVWYPFLADLKDKGISYGLIACFLYNRAIKIPLLPIIVFYFGLKYAVVLTFFMVLFSVVQGMIIDKIMG